ncbi:hypothetical protein PVIIG_06206 [Plasmodium vivax India VII]|uniref:Uncharacterized protein n=1 Tax=Plasmodium vivax India VII TaxID=1077284 RepID=A0A0J9UT18_PLAVI|nr:hypothetical protein PVIIG_06206 [Plasmodium vivax India VII]
MESSQDDDYYTIVDLFPTQEGRFDINNINYKYEDFTLCNSIGPRKNIIDEVPFISDCAKVARYIKGIYTEYPIENETYRCKYLNYSINSVIKNNGNLNFTEEQLIEAYVRLATELNVCKDSIKIIEDSVFKNIEELSNIYYKFNKQINMNNRNQTTDCPDFPHSVQSYQNIKSTCRVETKKFCDAVDKFKDHYLSKISQVKCKNVVYELESFLLLDHTKPLSFEEKAEGKTDRTEVLEDVIREGMGTENAEILNPVEPLDVDNNRGPPKDNASNPVRTITYTSLGLVLPLATLYRVKNNYLKNVIILYEY